MKIATLVFHILSLGIPLAVYHLVSWVFCRSSNPDDLTLSDTALNSILQTRPHSQFGQEAFAFARAQLAEHPELEPAQFAAGWNSVERTHQPVNPEIPLLVKLHDTIIYPALRNALQNHPDNPWSNPEVIAAADASMKVSYAISCLTLEDLPAFRENLSQHGIQRTNAEALTEQDSYLYRTFYDCTNAYHIIRGGQQWFSTHPYGHSDEPGLYFPREALPEDRVSPFYETGTVQNNWNQLYNEYCQRVRYYVKESDLKRADSRHVNWTQADVQGTPFRDRPDTQPT